MTVMLHNMYSMTFKRDVFDSARELDLMILNEYEKVRVLNEFFSCSLFCSIFLTNSRISSSRKLILFSSMKSGMKIRSRHILLKCDSEDVFA